MKDPEKMNILIRITRELKIRYHKRCLDRGITMKDELTNHIEEYVGDNI
jgi:hypothetical protein